MKSHSKRILSLVFALLMAFQQVMFAAQTVDLLTPAEQPQTVDLLTGEEENKTVDLLTPAEPSAPIEQPIEQSKPTIEENKVNENQNENQTVDLLTPGDDEAVPEEGKKSTTTILIGGEEEEETQDDSWDLTPAEITVPEENHDEEEKKDATFEDEEHHENAGVLPWSTDLVKPWSIYRELKKVYRPGEDLDLTELLVEIKTGRSGSLYNIEDLINDEFTTITRTRKSDGEKVRLDDKIYEDETMTIHMDGCQDLTIDFTVDENLKDEEKALEAFQDNLIREEFRDGLDFSLYLIKKGERENPIVAYSLDPHKLTPLGNGADKKLKDGPLFDLKDINTWDRFDIETIGKVKAILERSAEINNTENVRKKLITQLAIWNVTSNIIPREIDATVSEIEETETTDFGPELKPTDEEEIPEEKEEEPIEIIDPTTPEEEIESVKQDDEVEAVEEKTEIEEQVEEQIEAEEPVEEKTQENKESEKIEEQAPVQSTVHKIVFDVRDIDLPYNEVELSDEEYALYNELTSLEAIELKSEDEDLKIYEPIIEETENQYADLVTIGESDIDSIERVETEVTFDAVDYSFQNLYHTLETSSRLGFGQPRDFNVLLKATMKASRKIVEGDKFEVEILSKTLPILNGEEGRANDIQIDGKVVATAEYIAEEHKIVYTFVEDLDTDKVEIEQEFKQIKEEKPALLNMLDVSENLIADAVRDAEGTEKAEENPDELEISPEDDNATIKLVLGNTPVQYNGVSFETKKFRLKTTMTAKAFPIWQIPVGWTFDVKIGDYLKPDPDYPLKNLYDPDNPSVVIAEPKYNEANHTITYKYVKSISSTKTLDIDQYLAFDTDNIGTKDKIDINISVEPKNNPKQQMPTKTVYRDDRSPVITSAFEVEFDQNGEPNLNDGYKFFEYGPSYKVTFDAYANPIIENREVKFVEWTVVFDGNGENLNSKQLDLITNFTAVRNSGLKRIEDVSLNGRGITLNDNDMGDKFLINDSKYFDGHNNSESVYTFKFKTPVDSKQKAYVIDIAAKLRGVKKIGAVRLIMPAYEGARLEMVSPNDMTHSNRTTISGKFTTENTAEWIVTEEVSTGDQGALPLIERNISKNQTIDSLNVAYYGLDKDGKMAQFKKETPRKDNPIAAGNLDGEKTFAPGTIAVYEYKTSLLDSDKPQTYTLSNGAISKYRDVDVNITWSKRVENSKYPEHTVILVDDNNTEISQDKIDRLTEKELEIYPHVKIGKEKKYEKDPRIITKIPNVRLWSIDEKGNYTNINYKIFEQMPKKGTSDSGASVKYGEVYKTYDSVKDLYEIQNFVAEQSEYKPANISIFKVDENEKKLSGANFKLSGIKDIESQNESEDFTVEGTTDKDGKIDFLNVPPGLYTLQETKSPEGFEVNKKTDTITVKKDGSVKWTNNTISNVTYKQLGQITDWKSEVKYLNGSSAYPGYMNTLSYSEVDENNNFTAYIMLKPDVNTPNDNGGYHHTDRDTRVSIFGDNISNITAKIYDVDTDNRDVVKNALNDRNAETLFLTEVNNEYNADSPITIQNNVNDEFLQRNVSSLISIPSKRFGNPNPGWAFLIKVTGKIDNPKSDGKFSYRWLTDQNTQSNVKIADDTVIPNSNNRSEAIDPTFTIINTKAKITTLNIQKLDDKNNKLAGAEFSLYDSNGQIIKTGKTQYDGILKFEELSPGDYLLKETKSLDGYHNPELNFNIAIKEDGSIVYEVKDKKDNIVYPGEYYRIGEFGSEEPVEPPQKKEIIVEEARMYLDESDNYGQKSYLWEEAQYESYLFTGKFLLKNCKPNDYWEMDFDDHWNFTQWFGELPDIKSRDGQLIATANLNLSTNTIRYTLADTDYVKDHNRILVEVKYNSIRPSKYYVKNSGRYYFKDIINVGSNQKVINTAVDVDLGSFYGIDGDHTPKYITQNVDVYEENGKTMMRNVALFNVTRKPNLIGDRKARIYYGTSRNDGKLFREGEKITPAFEPTKVIVYRVNSPNSDNMPLSCGIRPSTRPDIYTKIAEYNDFSTKFIDTKQHGVIMDFNPGRLMLGANTPPSLGSTEGFQFQIKMPDNSPKGEGYVIEQFYEITDKNIFKKYYTQTFMAYLALQNNTIGFEQFKPTKNNSIGIGWNNEEPKPKNYDLTVFNKKQPGEFIVKKVSEKDSQGNVKVLAGAEFTLYDKNGKVVRRNSSNIKGVVEFKGLSEGTYTLKETVPPEGYKATDRTITVKIDKDGKVTFEGLKQDDDIFNILNNLENPTIQVTNKPNKTKVTIVKVDEKVNEDGSYKLLPGAIFGLFKEDGTTPIQKDGKNYEVMTDKDGKATFEDLEPGTYIIKEIKAPNGYEKTNKTWKVVVGEGNNVKVFERTTKTKNELNYSILNSGIESNINIAGKPGLSIKPDITRQDNGTFTCKIDIVNKYPDDNTKLYIPVSFKFDNENFKYKYNGNYVDEISNPKYYISHLLGKKTIEFEIIPNYTITVGEYKPILKVLMNDGELNYNLPILKITPKVKSQQGGGDNNFSKYKIIASNDMYYILNSQDDNDVAEIKSVIGEIPNTNSYYIDIIINRMYYTNLTGTNIINFNTDLFEVSPITQNISVSNEGQSKFDIDFYVRLGTHKVQYKITPKQGVSSKVLQPIKSMYCGGAQVSERNGDLIYLSYLLNEGTPTPEPEPDPDPDPTPTPDPTVPEEKEITDVTQNGNEFSFQVDNKYKGYEVEFKKVDSTSIGESELVYLEGAEFKIEIKDGDIFRPLKEDEKKLGANDNSTSDANGTITFKGLKPGRYRLIETKAPEHYHLNGSAVVFYIRESDGKAFIIEDGREVELNAESNRIKNIPKGTESFTVYKQGDDTKPLAGVEFTIYSFDGTKINTGITDIDGKVVFGELDYGTYILKETKTVDGYILDSTPKIINIGKDFKVPDNPDTPKDVSNAFIFDNGKFKQLRASEIRNNREEVVYPNVSESIFAELHYNIDPTVVIKPGDTFTMEFNDSVDLDGVDKTPDKEFDIYGPFGKFASAKVIGDYPNRRKIIYTVTNYVENNPIDSIYMLYPLYVNRFKFKTDGDVTVTAKLGNIEYSDNINVVFSNIFDLDKTGKNLMAYMRELHVDTKKFKSVVYVNPKGRPRYNKRIFFNSNQNYTIDSVKIYKVIDGNKNPMPYSFGIDFNKPSESGLEAYKGEVTGNKNDFIIKDTESLTEDGKNRYGSNAAYVLEVDGTVKTENLTDFRLGYNYYEYYQHDNGYENSYFDWSILRNVTEWVSNWVEYYEPSYRETFCQFYYPDSTTEGIRKITLKNHKNKIEYTKVDGTISGTSVDTKPQGAAEGSNEPIAVPRPMLSGEGKALQGAEFKLKKDGVFVENSLRISGEDGKFSWEGLAPGTYEVWETKAPDGYPTPKEFVSKFTVNEKGEIVDIENNTTIIINEKYKPNIEFKKVDGSNKEKTVVLPGAEFTLYKAKKNTKGEYEKVDGALQFGMVDNKCNIIPDVDDKGKQIPEDKKNGYKVTSDADGKFKFLKLEDGIYAVKETKAPAGYTKLLDYVFYFKVEGGKITEVDKDGNVVQVNGKDHVVVDITLEEPTNEVTQIKNFKAEYPSTGGVGALPFVFIGMMIMMVGAYMFIRRRDALYE